MSYLATINAWNTHSDYWNTIMCNGWMKEFWYILHLTKIYALNLITLLKMVYWYEIYWMLCLFQSKIAKPRIFYCSLSGQHSDGRMLRKCTSSILLFLFWDRDSFWIKSQFLIIRSFYFPLIRWRHGRTNYHIKSVSHINSVFYI